jgi:hypothetical protein
MIPIDTISCATRLPLYKYYFFTILWLLFNLFLLAFHYIIIYNVMLLYRPIRSYNLLKVKAYFKNEMKKNCILDYKLN